MKKELLEESIDDTIISACKWITKSFSCTDSNEQCLYQIDAIKALAELISARALIKNINELPYSSSDGSSKE